MFKTFLLTTVSKLPKKFYFFSNENDFLQRTDLKLKNQNQSVNLILNWNYPLQNLGNYFK